MSINHVTLTISEAFREGNISPDFLPPVILKSRSNGEVKFVLSEKEDCYYTATLEGCSCDQFISGMYPCPHQIRAWIGDVRELAKQKERLKKEREENLKRKQEEERLKKERVERLKKKQEEERLKKELEENLKREQEREQKKKEIEEYLKRKQEEEQKKKEIEENLKREQEE